MEAYKPAAIFDMDGTLINNTPYHFKAWQQMFELHNLPGLTHKTYLDEISGVPVAYTIKKFFGSQVKDQFIRQLSEEKQSLYEQAFKPYLKPINGLENVLAQLKSNGFKIALATSSNQSDIDFIFEGIPIKQYFDALITGNMVNEPKPSPQIFLKAANKLNANPNQCVVFEDSLAGLRAGRSAGMKVAGITTSHPAAVIAKLADMVINDYTKVTPGRLAELFEQTQA
ncbi:HAD family hydrolase [Mucilaginibacter litoreus]|uniref:Beta-phosphoglucomutase n=1 Tax=Mucilaginibacter litoreus TaxID=1048221 RepID=A0ABW3ASQ0_9SPHI